MDMRDVAVVGLNLVEHFLALLAFDFAYAALVSDVSFPSSEFLKDCIINYGVLKNQLSDFLTILQKKHS